MTRLVRIAAVLLTGALSIATARADLLAHFDGTVDASGPDLTLVDKVGGHNARASGGKIAAATVAAIGKDAISVPAMGIVKAAYPALTIAGSTDEKSPFNQAYEKFSMSMWVNPNPIGEKESGSRFLIGKMGGDNQRGWQLYRVPNSRNLALQYFPTAAGGTRKTKNVTLTDALKPGEFNLITITLDSGTVTAYVNGVKKEQFTGLDEKINGANNVPLQIGNRGPGSKASADATLDDIGLWNEALNPQKVAAMHALGKFAGQTLASETIAQLLKAFAEKGSVTIDGVKWQHKPGLGGVLGATGGAKGKDAYVVLDESGAGMQQTP